MNRAEVDHSICTGYAECARMAPGAFQLNSDNLSEFIDPPTETTDAGLLAAAEECPTNAIRVVDEAGSVVYESA
jgi:ferredoxin